MKTALWIVQVLLAALFLMTGVMKATTPMAELVAQAAWVSTVPAWAVRFAGISEVLGAIGLILPAATRIAPRLTPLAASGLAAVMVLASALHVSLGEFSALPVNVVLFFLAAFVAWGRTKKAPIAPRTAGAPAPAGA